MESEAQVESSPAPEAEVQAEEVMPESFNIFSDEPVQIADERPKEETSQKKSKQFLEKVRQDREARKQDIAFKQREAAIRAKEESLTSLMRSKNMLRDNPEEFLKSQGIDPMDYYRRWTEKMINDDGDVSIDTKVSDTQKELHALKLKMSQKEQAEKQAQMSAQQQQAYGTLIGEVESFAVSNEGYETIKGSCTARDIVNGMISHYRATGEELTIEEAFEKIESGLREREESFYKDPKIMEKLQRYNPEAMKITKSPGATLSSRFQQQPTRTDPEEMSYEEVREMFKGKLFT